MSLDLDDLYQQVILDHSKHPRNFHAIEAPTGRADGHNPLCGDRITVFLNVRSGRIEQAAFSGAGCAICLSSASIMTETLRGKTLAEAEALFSRFHDMLTGQSDAASAALELGKLGAFSGVLRFPIRVKCATLPWHTLRAAMRGTNQVVSTE